MLAVILVLATLATIVFLLNRKTKMGTAMLAGSALIFLGSGPATDKLAAAAGATVLGAGTWELILALFFVMCLEYQLRTGGIIDGFMAAARGLLRSERSLLVLMPSLLGFLPSLGGAVFSAPHVESAGRAYQLSAEKKTVINYWFRHVWEYTNPIFSGMLLASQLSGIPLGDLVRHMAWITATALLLGWLVLIAPLVPASGHTPPPAPAGGNGRRFVALALGPILANFALVVFFKLSAALSMACVVALMALILRQDAAGLAAMLRRALDLNLFWGVANIIFFQHILRLSGLVGDITTLLHSLAVPAAVVVGIVAFVGGLLTGTSQGFVAITFPFIALLAPGDLTLVSVCFVLGTAGHMLSPAHLCLLVTLDYFSADLLRALRPVLALEIAMVTAAAAVLTLWG